MQLAILINVTAYGAQDIESTREFALAQVQNEQLSLDLPAQDIAIDANHNVWVLGQRLLWKWVLGEKKGQQIQLSTSGSLRHQILASDRLYVTNDQDLFQIELEPFRVVQYSAPKVSSESSVSLSADDSGVFWTRSDGVYHLDKKGSTLEKLFSHRLTSTSEQKYFYLNKSQTLWFKNNNLLLLFSYKDKRKPRVLAKFNYKIISLHIVSGEVFALTAYSVLRFSADGQLIQTIPLESSRKTILASLQEDAHAYLFNDRLIEVHTFKDKSTNHYILNVERVKQASIMRYSDSFFVFIFDGNPRVFQLSDVASS